MELIVPVVLVMILIELVLSGTWSEFYFTVGLPVFRSGARLSDLPPGIEDDLAAAHTGGLAAPLVFHRLAGDQIAFREKALGFHLFSYTPLMHGLISRDSVTGSVSVTGYANWSAFAFAALALVAFREFDRIFLLFFVGLFGSLYTIQAYRYRSVVRSLSSPPERSNSALQPTRPAPPFS